MYSKILVPLDGSSLAERALPYAIKLTHSLKAQLRLLRVVESATFASAKPEDRKRNFAIAQTYLDSIKHSISSPDMALGIRPEQVETSVIEGFPGQEIAFTANNDKASLIVMTTHGRNGLTRLVLGSTTAEVIARSKVPVALIHPTKIYDGEYLGQILTEKIEPAPHNCLILTLDGSPKAESALETATTLAEQSDATLYLLRIDSPRSTQDYQGLVADYGYNYDTEIAKENQSRREQAYLYLDQVQQKIAKEGLNCIKAVRISNNPAEEIIKFAEEVRASAVVMTTDPHRNFNQLLIGSVADEVMQSSYRPVIIVGVNPSNGETQERGDEVYPLLRF